MLDIPAALYTRREGLTNLACIPNTIIYIVFTRIHAMYNALADGGEECMQPITQGLVTDLYPQMLWYLADLENHP